MHVIKTVKEGFEEIPKRLMKQFLETSMDTLKYENEINCSEYFTFFFLSRCFFFQIIIRIQKFIKFKNGYESFVNVWLIERRNIMKMLFSLDSVYTKYVRGELGEYIKSLTPWQIKDGDASCLIGFLANNGEGNSFFFK
jgi:nicotinamide mononucleotide adenylyltransferase